MKNMDAISAQKLWQAVLFQAVKDATSTIPDVKKCKSKWALQRAQELEREINAAREWLRKGGKDFRTVCSLAGMDPDFVRDAYLEGRIDLTAIHRAEVAA